MKLRNPTSLNGLRPSKLGRHWAELAEKTAVLLSRGVERRGHTKIGLPIDPLATAGALAQFTSLLACGSGPTRAGSDLSGSGLCRHLVWGG